MNKETFVWLTLGFGIGLLVASAVTFYSMVEDRRRTMDPRLSKAEALLDEVETLLKTVKKGKPVPSIE